MKFIKKISKETGNTESNNITKILKGSVISIILTIIGLLVYSVILANTEIGESTVNYIVMGITSISILIGSILSISKIEKNGAIVGGIYVIVIYLLSSIINSNFNINLSAIILMVVSIIAGMIGGIIGVNIKKQ